MATHRRIRGQGPQGRQAGRPSGAAADQVRAGNQSQDCQGDWAYHPGIIFASCRQGDRLMRRREFITLLAGAAAAWPLAAGAQQPAMLVVGYLDAGSPDEGIVALRRGLSDIGYVEDRNVVIEYRWAHGQYDRLPALAADLVRRRVTVIAACSTSAPGLAAKAATSAIPIVFQTGGDPVQDGLVTSMNRPGGNVTGVSRLSVTLAPKRLELLHELSPRTKVIGLLVNPANPRSEIVIQQMEEPARALGLRLNVLKASTQGELDGVFASLVQFGIG